MAIKISRTEKQFSKENFENEQELVRKLVSLGGKHTSPLHGSWEHFTITEKFRGRSATGASTCYPYCEWAFENGYSKELYAVDLDYSKFDNTVTIRQDGTLQGRFKESAKTQYSPNPVDVVNLLLEYGYLEIKEFNK